MSQNGSMSAAITSPAPALAAATATSPEPEAKSSTLAAYCGRIVNKAGEAPAARPAKA